MKRVVMNASVCCGSRAVWSLQASDMVAVRVIVPVVWRLAVEAAGPVSWVVEQFC